MGTSCNSKSTPGTIDVHTYKNRNIDEYVSSNVFNSCYGKYHYKFTNGRVWLHVYEVMVSLCTVLI